MSFRLLGHRLFQHGRQFVYNNCIKRNIRINILDHKKNRVTRQLGLAAKEGITNSNSWALRNNGLIRFGQHARRLFVDNILNRITPIYSADLRNEATKKFLFGDSVPLFALIGVCLASGNGIITKDDELEGVCWEIREAVSRLHDKATFGRANVKDSSELGLDDLIVGAPIAKGCSAVVYAAAFKDRTESSPLSVPDYDSDESSITSTDNSLSPLRDVNRYVHNFGSSLENPHFMNNSRNQRHEMNNRQVNMPRRVQFNSKPDVSYQSNRSQNRPDVSSHRNSNESLSSLSQTDETSNDIETYPLALKMMFNYDIQSNAMAILRAMYKETIPAINKYCNDDADGWEKQLMEQTIQLPPHPNIVLMVGVFCAQVPNLMQSSSLYPMALPQRLNPQGYGRNMSLFLLMKRYEYSLCEYLRSSKDISMRTRLLLFAQLLEGVAHLYRHGIAHRDLKSDNILIDLNGNDLHPVLVLSDFGCCLADKNNGLTLPYTSMDIDNENVPLIVRKLVMNILHRNPNQRLSPDIAANVMQLFLWAPSSWLKPLVNVNSAEILQWLLSLTTKVLYETRLGGIGTTQRDPKDKFGLRNIESNRTHTEEFLGQAWMKSSKKTQAEHISQMTKRFNDGSRLVCSEIISRSSMQARVAAIEKWTAVADICRCLHNFNGVLQICAAFTNAAVFRLKKTWDKVPKTIKHTISKLQSVVSSDGRFRSMREALHRCDPPCIPYLGMYLTDLSFIEEGTPDFTPDGLLNFSKMRMLAYVIREIRHFQQTPYKIEHIPKVTSYLLDASLLLDDDELYSRSLQIEPRTSRLSAPIHYLCDVNT